jgi:hypothetical protein
MQFCYRVAICTTERPCCVKPPAYADMWWQKGIMVQSSILRFAAWRLDTAFH